MRLLKTHNLTVYRKTANTGYVDNDGNWVSGTTETPFNLQGSRQPFRNGDEQIELPSGVSSEDAFFYFSKQKLFTNDEFLNQEADEMEFNGKRYECFRVEDWTGYNLKTDHYRNLLIRKDKLSGGV